MIFFSWVLFYSDFMFIIRYYDVSTTHQSRIFLILASLNLKVKHYVASKRRQLFTSRHVRTFQKIQFFISTALKSHSLEMLSSFVYFLCSWKYDFLSKWVVFELRLPICRTVYCIKESVGWKCLGSRLWRHCGFFDVFLTVHHSINLF
jgi:hypothetical protein